MKRQEIRASSSISKKEPPIIRLLKGFGAATAIVRTLSSRSPPTVSRWRSRDWEGKSFLTLRGPETAATVIDCPAEGQWVGIRFKPGTFMQRFLPGSLRDHKDVTLPPATGRSFWLNGSAVEYPSFDNAETFVGHLAKSGTLSRDPIVEDTLQRRPGELSLRSLQRRFLRSTGITYATFRQIERARYATILLREGVSILDVVSRLGYFDQAHLTRSLKRFIGETPAKIILRQKQLSFLYKTTSSAEVIFAP